ncbi:uncharacterized protein LOC106659574 [Trichogramma pretiosum]|uniref:uncharacterized protein LOC106659574 n=1 Tax=Trichogramma pretiosum TaxID=7493 RepID=UPI000C71BBA9|nr:uncharacterized protein LOC106659574 [Trichogramma pretiosum]
MSDPFRSATTTSEEEEEEREIYSSSGAMGKKTKSKKSHKKNKKIRTSPSDQQQQQQQQERSKIEPESVQQKPDRDVERRRRREETNYFDPRELEKYQQVNRTPENSSKMCSFCLITGHATSDCDLRRQCKILNKLRCEFCEFYGHSIDDCPIYGNEICSFCGLKGHDHERCETLIKAMRGSQNATRKSPPEAKKCTFCGDPGHDDEYCPKKEEERRSSMMNYYTRTSSIHSYTESENNTNKYGFEKNNKEKTLLESKKEKCTFCDEKGHNDDHCPKKAVERRFSLMNYYTRTSSIHSYTESNNNTKKYGSEENNEEKTLLESKKEKCTFCDEKGHNDDHCPKKEEERRSSLMNYYTSTSSINSQTDSKNNIKENELEENNKEKTSHESKREKCTFCGKNGHDDVCCPEKERVKENSFNSIYSPNLDNWSTKDSVTTLSSVHSQTRSENNIKINQLEENNEKNITLDSKVEECTFCGIEGHDDEHCLKKKEAREKPMLDYFTSDMDHNKKYSTRNVSSSYPPSRSENNFSAVPGDMEERNSNFYSKSGQDNECSLQLKQDKGNSSDSERNLLQGSKIYLMNAFQSFFNLGSKPSDSNIENDEKPFQEVKHKKKNKTLECELCSEQGHKKENCPIQEELEKLDLCDQASKQARNETPKCELCLKHWHKKENCPMVKELEKSDLYGPENKDYDHSSYFEYDKKKESYPVAKGLGKYENNDSFDHRNVNCGLPSYSDCLKDSKKNPKSSKNINSKKDSESDLCNKYQNMNLCNANQDIDMKKNKSSTEQLQAKILTGVRELLPIICTMHHCCYKCHPPIKHLNHDHISCKFMNEKFKLCDANVQRINCNICDRQCAYAEDPKEN